MNKICVILIFLFFIACDESSNSSYAPLKPNCNTSNPFEDATGSCCNYEDVDCNGICFGTMVDDACNVCGGDSSSCDLGGCNDPEASNYNETSSNNNNCIYDAIDEGWTWVWGDEFKTSSLDVTKWDYQLGTGSQYGMVGWGNNELQYYTNEPTNLFFDTCDNDKQCLVISGFRQTYESSEYTSARIRSAGSGIRTYGRIDVRAKLPTAQGTWPAIWMLPEDMIYGGWPSSGEIDIMEHVGCDLGSIHGSIHCDSYNHIDGTEQTSSINNIAVDQFHIYRIDWDADGIKWYVDDVLYNEFSNENSGSSSWPFDQDFYIILNLAIGGTWGGFCGVDSESLSLPQKMEIDYVRFFQKDN